MIINFDIWEPAVHATTSLRTLVLSLTVAGTVFAVAVGVGFAAAAKADFALAATPATQTVQKGTGAASSISLAPSNGFSAAVALSATAQANSGLTIALSPSYITGQSTSTMTVGTASAALGTWTVMVTGTGGGATHSTSFAVTVNAARGQSFTLVVAPQSVQVLPGDAAYVGVTINRSGSFTGAVALVTAGLPSGASATFSPLSPVAGGSSTLQVATTSTTATGTYPLTISGAVPQHSTQTATVQLVITDKGKSFALTGSVSGLLVPGGKAGDVDLTVSNPNNQTMSVNSITVAVTGTSAGSSCGSSNFAVTQLPAAAYPITLLKNQTAKLSALTTSQLPTVRLLNLPVSQDACKNVSVYLSYTGSATG